MVSLFYMMNLNMKLKIALQKSGRLHENSINILKESGIEFNNGFNKLKSEAYNFPLEVFFFRDDDIPQYVEDGVADIGIVGENVVREKGKDIVEVEKLGFGKCRLSVAVPKEMNYNSNKDLTGLNIATTYPMILQNYLDAEGLTATIHQISGSVEIAPGIGLSDAICDLVNSGSTLFSNGLKEVEVIMQSEALLVANKKLEPWQNDIVERLLFRLKSVKKSKHNKYILLNAPNDKLDKIIQILPGMKSPTIVPLAKEGWSSLHSVVNEDDFWELIESLKANGAQGILVVPIEKMII